MAEKHAPRPQTLKDILTQLMDLTAQLPFKKRTPAQCSADGHLLFTQAADFTAQVSFTLNARPALYADLPEGATAINQSQELADLYYELHFHFKTMSRLCEDSYMYYQADAVRRGKANLDYILHGYRGACMGFDPMKRAALNFHRRRAELLYPAFAILRQVRGHLGRRQGAPSPRKPTRSPGDQAPAAAAQKPPGNRPPGKNAGKTPIGARLFAAFLGREDPER